MLYEVLAGISLISVLFIIIGQMEGIKAAGVLGGILLIVIAGWIYLDGIQVQTGTTRTIIGYQNQTGNVTGNDTITGNVTNNANGSIYNLLNIMNQKPELSTAISSSETTSNIYAEVTGISTVPVLAGRQLYYILFAVAGFLAIGVFATGQKHG